MAKIKVGPVETRLSGASGGASGKLWKKHSEGVGVVDASAAQELIGLAQRRGPEEDDCCQKLLLSEFKRVVLPPSSASGDVIVRLFDGNGDGRLDATEWALATELLGVTAGEDELSHDVRRHQLEHLVMTATSRLRLANALELGPSQLMGRCIQVDGFEQPMMVVGVPKEGVGKFFRSKEANQDFELRPRGAPGGKTIPGVKLR